MIISIQRNTKGADGHKVWLGLMSAEVNALIGREIPESDRIVFKHYGNGRCEILASRTEGNLITKVPPTFTGTNCKI